MPFEMCGRCEKCGAVLPNGGQASICSFECTFLRDLRRRDGGYLPELRWGAAAGAAAALCQARERDPVELLCDEIPCALGTIIIAAREGRLCAVDYGDCGGRMMALLGARYDSVDLVPASDPFGFSRAIRAYLSGDLQAVDDIAVETGGTPFQRQVWTTLRRIPPGRTITYGELALAIGRPAAARAVGAANARNPLSIVVPCHRVIGKSASLTGYAGGLARKHWLLAHEGAVCRTPAYGGMPSTLIRPID